MLIALASIKALSKRWIPSKNRGKERRIEKHVFRTTGKREGTGEGRRLSAIRRRHVISTSAPLEVLLNDQSLIIDLEHTLPDGKFNRWPLSINATANSQIVSKHSSVTDFMAWQKGRCASLCQPSHRVSGFCRTTCFFSRSVYSTPLLSVG